MKIGSRRPSGVRTEPHRCASVTPVRNTHRMGTPTRGERDRPWVMRTYAGHSSPAESNALYRRKLAKGQTGLSVAFDLPTQTGY
ncbi:MAG TPA: methylmalonyl-CoA mutase family protein, partial [Jatrophihabitans sp.]|nr:methylmalonyl-CoA mutase family protein [Jatrophihabitans sp.]